MEDKPNSFGISGRRNQKKAKRVGLTYVSWFTQAKQKRKIDENHLRRKRTLNVIIAEPKQVSRKRELMGPLTGGAPANPSRFHFQRPKGPQNRERNPRCRAFPSMPRAAGAVCNSGPSYGKQMQTWRGLRHSVIDASFQARFLERQIRRSTKKNSSMFLFHRCRAVPGLVLFVMAFGVRAKADTGEGTRPYFYGDGTKDCVDGRREQRWNAGKEMFGLPSRALRILGGV